MYAWDQWRIMRANVAAPFITEGRYVVVRETEIEQHKPVLAAHLVCWAQPLLANLPRHTLEDIAPEEQARVRYAMDYHPDDVGHLALRQTLSDLGSVYYGTLDKIPYSLRPDDPESLTSPVYDVFASPESYVSANHCNLTGEAMKTFRNVWARAIEAKENLNAAERQLFGGL